ncbi:MAG: signal peptidase I [Eggerthellaceae bacterium]|nr:signal peptidase I [Eggerthellaceae bacterium]
MASGQAVPLGSSGQVRFTTADYRRELERVLKARKRKVALVVFVVILVVALIVAAVFVFGVSARAVDDSRMEPALSQGQHVIMVNARDLSSGTVIAYHDNTGELQFGRIVAGPGDWVSVDKQGTVAVSNSALSADSAANVFGSNASSITTREIPESKYYVLGDAESATTSGLTSEADLVSGDQVVGQAVAKVWPITSVGLVA